MMKNIPGILLCLAIAIPAWFLGASLPIVGSPVFGILIGMLVIKIWPALLSDSFFGSRGNARSSGFQFDCGVKFTSKKLLQFSIVLLGFEMDLMNVLKVGKQSLLIILFTLSASFLTAYILGKLMKIDGKMTALIGVGTSICGGSAIAAAAPAIRATDKDISQAISTIFLFNIAAVFIFPSLGHLFHMTDTGFGMWAGTAINDTSSVVAAGTAWSNISGNNTALAFATIVKLTRTLMIVPVTLVLAFYTAKKNRNSDAAIHFSFRNAFPWFVLAFISTAFINTILDLPFGLSHSLASFGKFIIIMAMAAIGLNTDLNKLITSGTKPLFLGLCCWFSVAAVSLILQHLTGLW